MTGQEQQNQQAQQHEEGEASGSQLDLQAVTRAMAGETRAGGEQPIPDLQVREIYADDTESDDQPS
ncbi:MAG TPA: hypothetical protein VIL85_21850 [Thermomicrobiales bacterium]|jgi:hypothetical protein